MNESLVQHSQTPNSVTALGSSYTAAKENDLLLFFSAAGLLFPRRQGLKALLNALVRCVADVG